MFAVSLFAVPARAYITPVTSIDSRDYTPGNVPDKFLTVDTYPHLEKLGCADCERIYFPVCASNHKTYTNICKMNCWNEQRLEWQRVKAVR